MIHRAFSQSCCTTPSAMCFWATAFIFLYGLGLLAGSAWPALRAYTDTYLLASLGVACLANFGQNRTLHCGITGPAFLIGALAMGTIESRLWNADPAVIWGVVLIVVAGALIIEWRTVAAKSESETCCAPPSP